MEGRHSDVDGCEVSRTGRHDRIEDVFVYESRDSVKVFMGSVSVLKLVTVTIVSI